MNVPFSTIIEAGSTSQLSIDLLMTSCSISVLMTPCNGFAQKNILMYKNRIHQKLNSVIPVGSLNTVVVGYGPVFVRVSPAVVRVSPAVVRVSPVVA